MKPPLTIATLQSEARVFADVTNLSILQNRNPEVDIVSPNDGDELQQRSLITLAGLSRDLEDDLSYSLTPISMVWSSNVDGLLGTGPIVYVGGIETIGVPPSGYMGGHPPVGLSLGSHVITLQATDSDGAVASKSITINVIP